MLPSGVCAGDGAAKDSVGRAGRTAGNFFKRRYYPNSEDALSSLTFFSCTTGPTCISSKYGKKGIRDCLNPEQKTSLLKENEKFVKITCIFYLSNTF